MNIYSKAVEKQEKSLNDLNNKVQSKVNGLKAFKLITGTAIVILFLSNLALISYLFNVNKAKDVRISSLLDKVSGIEGSLNSIQERLSTISVELNDGLKPFYKRVKDVEAEMLALEKQDDIQDFAIENLTKAKNNAFERMNILAEKIDFLQAQASPCETSPPASSF